MHMSSKDNRVWSDNFSIPKWMTKQSTTNTKLEK